MKSKFLALLGLFVLLALPAQAESGCPDKYAGMAPRTENPQLATHARKICYTAFAVLHSGISKGPLWSAERLTRESVAAARGVSRSNNFHPESRLAAKERAELRDYVRSGFDRGHMAPAGNMPDAKSMEESFSLANIIPQDPDNNRNLWAGIEAAARGLATRHGEVFIVSGVTFEGSDIGILNGRVLIPTRLYKAVYIPDTGEAGAWLVENAPGNKWQAVSIEDVRRISGIDPFPGISEAAKRAGMTLPAPSRRSSSQ